MITWRKIVCVEEIPKSRLLLVVDDEGVPDFLKYDKDDRCWRLHGNEIGEEYILESFTYFCILNRPGKQ